MTAPTGLRILAKEISAYGVVGGVNFLVDLGIYQVMYAQLHQGALVSKVVSTMVTSVLAYVMHKRWSFSHRTGRQIHHELPLFLGLSALSLGIGLAVIGTVRYGFDQTDVLVLQIANIASIGIGVLFRFWAYRSFVFVA